MNEKMKAEALKRLKTLGVMPEVIKAFKKDGVVYYSERANRMFPAVLYFLSNEDKYMELKKKFEEKTGDLVYHAILTHTEFGDCLDFLYVSKHEEEWEMDNEDLSDGYVLVYSNNLSAPDCSEFGSIAVRSIMGGLERTA